MTLKFYYLRAGLQARDAFFGNIHQIHKRSSSLADHFPGRVLLEAERRYGPVLVQSSVDKLSVFCGWHSSLSNRHYHYTLRGYDRVGWMAIALEMEAGKRGRVYRYGHDDWQRWMARALAQGQGTLGAKYIFHAGDHVEVI
ncbi:hypothetical protein EDD18DRAFT_1360663 [Armillaria luteobubalina]|uniref:Uncharacterized protein n=1 Tax=Armillaria luteobubalina TaxID=153913 RepID=A0AA39PM59_9AGAR|nr:hypothetical protein EDD18DRAFT_1360663 [Armillaria luteobubalina]